MINFIRPLEDAASGAVSAAGESSSWISILSTVLPFVLLILVFYFLLWRPQKKQQKEMANMRDSIERGDIITTTGGIVGVVVNAKDDMILIETGADKTRIQVQKWAVHSVEQKADGTDAPAAPKQ